MFKMKFKSLSSPVADNLSQQIHLKKAGVGNCNLFFLENRYLMSIVLPFRKQYNSGNIPIHALYLIILRFGTL